MCDPVIPFNGRGSGRSVRGDRPLCCPAHALAYCWRDGRHFPQSFGALLERSGVYIFRDTSIIGSVPEYGPSGPYCLPSSHGNILVFARTEPGQLLPINVRGILSEGFGDTAREWLEGEPDRREENIKVLRYLCGELLLDPERALQVRYELLKRTVQPLVWAKKFNLEVAMMIVQSFGELEAGFDDYQHFLELFGLRGARQSLSGYVNVNGIRLFFGWVREP